MKKTVRASKLQYKCRKCGEVFSPQFYYEELSKLSILNLNDNDQQLDYIDDMLKKVVNKDDPFRHKRIYLYNEHLCSDGSLGVGDFCGLTKPIELPVKRGAIVQPERE